MAVSRASLDQAVAGGIITADQRDRLIALAEAPAAGAGTERAPAIMVAYATGALAVLFAFGWFLIERWQRLGPGGVLVGDELHHVHLVGVDRERHLIRLRVQVREHVPRVVAQPLGRLALVLRGEAD